MTIMIIKYYILIHSNTVTKLVKYTGYGNAAGMLARRGLLAGGRGNTDYSSDEDDSDTDDYLEVRNKWVEEIYTLSLSPETPSSPLPLKMGYIVFGGHGNTDYSSVEDDNDTISYPLFKQDNLKMSLVWGSYHIRAAKIATFTIVLKTNFNCDLPPRRVLLAGRRGNTDYSSDEDDSDTDDYLEVRNKWVE